MCRWKGEKAKYVVILKCNYRESGMKQHIIIFLNPSGKNPNLYDTIQNILEIQLIQKLLGFGYIVPDNNIMHSSNNQ